MYVILCIAIIIEVALNLLKLRNEDVPEILLYICLSITYMMEHPISQIKLSSYSNTKMANIR